MHLEVDQKYYLRQKKKDDGVPLVLDSLDNYMYKILSERMNIYVNYLFIFPVGELKFRAQPESAVHMYGTCTLEYIKTYHSLGNYLFYFRCFFLLIYLCWGAEREQRGAEREQSFFQ